MMCAGLLSFVVGGSVMFAPTVSAVTVHFFRMIGWAIGPS